MSMSYRQRHQVVLAALLVAGLVSCAEVSVTRIPNRYDYDGLVDKDGNALKWTHEEQQDADQIDGVRFYLPRPYLTVHEPFPIQTKVYLVNGVISPDGHYVIIAKTHGDLGGVFQADVVPKVDVPGYRIPLDIVRRGAPQGAGSQLGPTGLSTGPSNRTEASERTGQPTDGGTGASRVEAKTGINELTVTNDNSAFAMTMLRRYFDVLYLPDFEEQYAVSGVSGLGNASAQVALGQGWSLQGMHAVADNSELNKRIFDVIDTSIDLAKSAAFNALGIPVPPGAVDGLTQVLSSTAGPQGEPSEKELLAGGTPVTLKVIIVSYAAPGVYPVLKPRELREAKAQNVQSQTTDMAVPIWPYTHIAFNVFKYIVVECVTTDRPALPGYTDRGQKDDSTTQRQGQGPDPAPINWVDLDTAVKSTPPGSWPLDLAHPDGKTVVITFTAAAPSGATLQQFENVVGTIKTNAPGYKVKLNAQSLTHALELALRSTNVTAAPNPAIAQGATDLPATVVIQLSGGTPQEVIKAKAGLAKLADLINQPFQVP